MNDIKARSKKYKPESCTFLLLLLFYPLCMNILYINYIYLKYLQRSAFNKYIIINKYNNIITIGSTAHKWQYNEFNLIEFCWNHLWYVPRCCAFKIKMYQTIILITNYIYITYLTSVNQNHIHSKINNMNDNNYCSYYI